MNEKELARNDVMLFAVAMEKVLQENDWKDGWDGETINYLYIKFEEEVREVKGIVGKTFIELYDDQFEMGKFQLKKELVDVANLCMMLWSRIK